MNKGCLHALDFAIPHSSPLLLLLQVMPKSQLAGLMMCTMLVQTVAAPPLSRIAKTSVRTRNRMLLAGLAPMIAANAIFATASSAAGQ